MGRSQCLEAVLVTPAFCLTTGLICVGINQLLKETPTNKIGADNAYEVNIWDIRPDPIYGTGAIVDFAAVPVPIIYKVGGKWNTYEIYAKGAQMTVWHRDGRRTRQQISRRAVRASVRRWRQRGHRRTHQVAQGADQAAVTNLQTRVS